MIELGSAFKVTMHEDFSEYWNVYAIGDFFPYDGKAYMGMVRWDLDSYSYAVTINVATTPIEDAIPTARFTSIEGVRRYLETIAQLMRYQANDNAEAASWSKQLVTTTENMA